MALEAIVLFKAWFIAGWFAAIFVAERLAAAAPPPKEKARLVSNIVLWGLVLLGSPLIVLPLTNFAAVHALWARPPSLTGWPALIGDLILLDFWVYWVHRAYHRVPLMWRLHAPHHLDEHLDSTSALRFHTGEVALSALLRMAPIVVLAIPFTHVVAYETLLLAGAIFHHSNVRLPPWLETALSRVIVTPSIHWVHHHAVWTDTDSNYAGVFSLWDPLFGTRSKTARTREMKIGVENHKERSLLLLLVTPFLRRVR
jgi:sterol desaturase/sphingolipid hydroxylase (fatty acid hydroxylase superfamily)